MLIKGKNSINFFVEQRLQLLIKIFGVIGKYGYVVVNAYVIIGKRFVIALSGIIRP